MSTNIFTTLIQVVCGDENYDLNFTLQDAAAVAVDLTNATLTFEAQLVADYTVQFSGAMDVIVAANGTCKYTVASTDFPIAGQYNVQIVAVYSGSGKQLTWPNILVTALAAVPQ